MATNPFGKKFPTPKKSAPGRKRARPARGTGTRTTPRPVKKGKGY